MKMMDIDSEHLGIPEQDYSAVVGMPSTEFLVCTKHSRHNLLFVCLLIHLATGVFISRY